MNPSRFGLEGQRLSSAQTNRPTRTRRARRPRLDNLEGRQLLAVSQLAGLPGLSTVEASPFSGEVATFQDTNPQTAADSFGVTVDWGDGNTSVGTVAKDASGTFHVSGTHTYAQAGSYPIGLSVTDASQQTTTIGFYTQIAIASNVAGHAQSTDPNLVGPVGLASTGGGPWWVADAAKGIATVYNGETGLTSPMVVTIPPSAQSPTGASGSPTGIVFNNTNGFSVDPSGTAYTFLFATRDGTISAWSSGSSASLKLDLSTESASFQALTIGQTPDSVYLYATDFHNGQVDIINNRFEFEDFHIVQVPSASVDAQPAGSYISGPFVDPNLPAGYAPFGIQSLGGQIYVTYAQQDAAKLDPVAGAGKGLIDVFDQNGFLGRRLVTGGALNAPYGMALAPAGFGLFAGDLLVSNFGDGRINAYDPTTGAYKGQLEDTTGQPITGLRGLGFGNEAQAGPSGTLYFTAASSGGTGGLFGSITPLATTSATSIQVGDAPLQAQSATFSGSESYPLPSPLVVARFSDANPNASPSDFTATIDWGDGATSTGTVSTALYPPGTAQSGTPSGSTFSVLAFHAYSEEGTYHVSVTVNDAGGSTVVAHSEADIADVAPTARPSPITTTEGQPFSGTVATFSEPPVGFLPHAEATPTPTSSFASLVPFPPPESINDFSATINWGDGSTSPGVIVPAGYSNFAIQGTHTYADAGASGTYPVTVTIVDDGGTSTQVVSTASVADRAIPLTGGLSPASDTGVSSSDRITSDTQPTFTGSSEPGSFVALLALPESGGPAAIVGSGITNPTGHWQIATSPLADGRYTITAVAVDRFNRTTDAALLVASDRPLVIDTQAPKVASVVFNPNLGQVLVTFQDNLSGFDQASLRNAERYSVAPLHSRTHQRLAITRLDTSVIPPGTTQAVALSLNGGARIQGGPYVLTIGPGVRDLAGNPLEGGSFTTLLSTTPTTARRRR